jgi:hypothetical protein
MFEQQLVVFSKPAATSPSEDGLLSLVGATILFDIDEPEGVAIAATSLAEDLNRVSGTDSCPVLRTRVEDRSAGVPSDTAIITGTIEASSLIQSLAAEQQIRTDTVQGKRECFHTTVIEKPVCAPGFKRALVIVGSDKRGAIYGAYTICEQIGVSPYAASSHTSTSIDYRGLTLLATVGTGGQTCRSSTTMRYMRGQSPLLVKGRASSTEASLSTTRRLH